jgi:trk system potassium uptake protein TrkA
MYVIVVGAGKVGVFLSLALKEHSHEVLLVEEDPTKYEQLFEKWGELIFLGDGSDTRTLLHLGVERANVVVAVTGDDEDNLAISLAAKRLAVPRVIARINNPKNEEIFKLMGIQRTISSTRILFNMVEQEVEMAAVRPFLALHRGEVEALKLEVSADSILVGQKISELGLPEGATVSGLVRADRLLPVKPELAIEEGDWLLVMAPSEVIPTLEACLRLGECDFSLRSEPLP